jgi:hypothetical protein
MGKEANETNRRHAAAPKPHLGSKGECLCTVAFVRFLVWATRNNAPQPGQRHSAPSVLSSGSALQEEK